MASQGQKLINVLKDFNLKNPLTIVTLHNMEHFYNKLPTELCRVFNGN